MSNDKIFKTGANRAHQCGARPIQKTVLHRRDCSCSDTAVWSFRAAGLPVFTGSREGQRDFACSGAEGGLHGQTPCEPGGSLQTTGQVNGGIFKCSGDTGPGRLSQKRGAWLSGIVGSEFRCCTTLIGWPLENYLKSISFWFQRGRCLLMETRNI